MALVGPDFACATPLDDPASCEWALAATFARAVAAAFASASMGLEAEAGGAGAGEGGLEGVDCLDVLVESIASVDGGRLAVEAAGRLGSTELGDALLDRRRSRQ